MNEEVPKHDKYVGYACEIEARMGFVFDAYTDQSDIRAELMLGWIAENPNDDSTPEMAADWLRDQMMQRKSDPAGRLGRAIKRGHVRRKEKEMAVAFAVAEFLRNHRRWPKRSEIIVNGASERSRDLFFEMVAEWFDVKLDGREKWVDPQ